MKRCITSYILFLITSVFSIGCSQNPSPIRLSSEKYEQKLNRLLSYELPLISIDSFRKEPEKFVILDTRSKEEFEVSHIPGARWIGFPNPSPAILETLDPKDTIITYCSVGYRSEKMGLKLKALGFSHVYNLYGSLFEWINLDYPVLDAAGHATFKVHGYNKKWSQWILNPKYEKIY